MNPEQTKRYEREYRARHRKKLAQKAAEYKKKYPERVKAALKKSRMKRRSYHRRLYLEIKMAAMEAYGGKCVCCGESNQCFLTIDHANNDGAAHRKERASDGGQYEGNGFGIYRWLKKNKYPQDGRFQVLCYNCNCCKQHDPIGHRKAHPNARNIDGLGEIDGEFTDKKQGTHKTLRVGS